MQGQSPYPTHFRNDEGSLMLLGCFEAGDPGDLRKVGIINSAKY